MVFTSIINGCSRIIPSIQSRQLKQIEKLPKIAKKKKSRRHTTMAPWPTGTMQCNHGALRLGAVRKGQIVKFLQIRFILCWSF
jgi:hypothetical protein